MKLSPNFTMEEATFSQTAIRKGIVNTPNDQQLANMKVTASRMEDVRTLLGKPINVSSWLRVLLLNRAIGSDDSSGHVLGFSVDFTSRQYGTPYQICKAIIGSGIKFDQLIFEGTWCHISFHPKMRQQVLTAIFAKGKKTTYKSGIV